MSSGFTGLAGLLMEPQRAAEQAIGNIRGRRNARDVAERSAQLFEGFGGQGAQFAQVLRQNPQTGLAMAQQFGGLQQLYSLMAQQQGAAQQQQALQTLAGTGASAGSGPAVAPPGGGGGSPLQAIQPRLPGGGSAAEAGGGGGAPSVGARVAQLMMAGLPAEQAFSTAKAEVEQATAGQPELGNIDPAKYEPTSLQRFVQTRDLGDLVPVDDTERWTLPYTDAAGNYVKRNTTTNEVEILTDASDLASSGGLEFKDLAKARQDFLSDSQGFDLARDAYETLQGALQDPNILNNRAAQIGVVFNFIKNIEPNSTVREGEFKLIENARPLLKRYGLEGLERVWRGNLLLEDEIRDIGADATRSFALRVRRQQEREKSLTSFIQRNGGDPSKALEDRIGPHRATFGRTHGPTFGPGQTPPALGATQPPAATGPTQAGVLSTGRTAPPVPQGAPSGSRFHEFGPSGQAIFIDPDGRRFVEE